MSVHTNGDSKIHTFTTELVMWLLNYTLQVKRFSWSQALKHHHCTYLQMDMEYNRYMYM